MTGNTCLSNCEVRNIIRHFPKVELSYEKYIHKKVPADLYMILPRGKRCFLWFTHYHRQNIAAIVTTDQQGRVKNLRPIILAFNNSLSSGTVISGTEFRFNGLSYFCADDIQWNNAENVSRLSSSEKLLTLGRIMSQIGRNKHASLIVGTPVTATTYNDAMNVATTIPYQIRGIQARKTWGNGNIVGIYKPEISSRAVFGVRATIESDIYELLCDAQQSLVFHSIAAVLTYEDSVMMNRIFRTIRENDNLDLLEESDDEDIFENISPDKYVSLDKNILMECVYVPRFSKWRPIRVVPKEVQPTALTIIDRIEKI